MSLVLVLLLAACEGGGTGPETLMLPGSSQVNLTLTVGPGCPPVLTVDPPRRR
jgi:hypothetical protein